ncbi:MAG: hypothetical protein AB8E15_02755 [Bdellovibrionales bacterium]
MKEHTEIKPLFVHYLDILMKKKWILPMQIVLALLFSAVVFKLWTVNYKVMGSFQMPLYVNPITGERELNDEVFAFKEDLVKRIAEKNIKYFRTKVVIDSINGHIRLEANGKNIDKITAFIHTFSDEIVSEQNEIFAKKVSYRNSFLKKNNFFNLVAKLPKDNVRKEFWNEITDFGDIAGRKVMLAENYVRRGRNDLFAALNAFIIFFLGSSLAIYLRLV